MKQCQVETPAATGDIATMLWPFAICKSFITFFDPFIVVYDWLRAFIAEDVYCSPWMQPHLGKYNWAMMTRGLSVKYLLRQWAWIHRAL